MKWRKLMTFEEQLCEAAFEAHRIIMSDMPEPEECFHEFSKKFERNIGRLTKRVDTPVKYRLQQAACIIVAFLSLVSVYFSVNTDAQARFFGWVKETYEVWIHHFFEGDNTDTPVQKSEYRPTWLPDGYKESAVHAQPAGMMIIYKNENDESIRFHFTTNLESRNLFIGGEHMTELTVQVNGRDAQIYESADDETAPVIVWRNEDDTVLFAITGYIEPEDLVKMAESVE